MRGIACSTCGFSHSGALLPLLYCIYARPTLIMDVNSHKFGGTQTRCRHNRQTTLFTIATIHMFSNWAPHGVWVIFAAFTSLIWWRIKTRCKNTPVLFTLRFSSCLYTACAHWYCSHLKLRDGGCGSSCERWQSEWLCLQVHMFPSRAAEHKHCCVYACAPGYIYICIYAPQHIYIHPSAVEMFCCSGVCGAERRKSTRRERMTSFPWPRFGNHGVPFLDARFLLASLKNELKRLIYIFRQEIKVNKFFTSQEKELSENIMLKEEVSPHLIYWIN